MTGWRQIARASRGAIELRYLLTVFDGGSAIVTDMLDTFVDARAEPIGLGKRNAQNGIRTARPHEA